MLSAAKGGPANMRQNQALVASVERVLFALHTHSSAAHAPVHTPPAVTDGKQAAVTAAHDKDYSRYVFTQAHAQDVFGMQFAPFWQQLNERLSRHGPNILDVQSAALALTVDCNTRQRRLGLSEESIVKLVNRITEQSDRLNNPHMLMKIVQQMSLLGSNTSAAMPEQVQHRLLTALIAQVPNVQDGAFARLMLRLSDVLPVCITESVQAQHMPALRKAFADVVTLRLNAGICDGGMVTSLMRLGVFDSSYRPDALVQAVVAAAASDASPWRFPLAAAEAFSRLDADGGALHHERHARIRSALLQAPLALRSDGIAFR